ncbi:MAG TPA: hypothetical protein VME44_26430 [Streptosporangiaceae bacterium]|nr:hypothetical protein [Streptosporangiaceae bacterium]
MSSANTTEIDVPRSWHPRDGDGAGPWGLVNRPVNCLPLVIVGFFNQDQRAEYASMPASLFDSPALRAAAAAESRPSSPSPC